MALDAVDLQTAFQHAADGLASVLGADKVDVFVREDDLLVALGTSDTPMGRREHDLGLDRLSLGDAGRLGHAYHARRGFFSPRSVDDPGELCAVVEQLGVRSSVGAPVLMGEDVLGVVLASSATPDFFGPRDLGFLEAVAGWLGLVAHRAARVEQLTTAAAAAGVRLGAEQVIRELTPRKREVATLVSRGLTNAEIARRLALSEGTVANHVQEILQRLGLRSRTQLAVWISERTRPT